MNVKLYNKPNESWPTICQILYNRGMPIDEIQTYLSTEITDISPAEMLGESNLEQGLKMIAEALSKDADILVPVDCDVDGYTSAALFINYMHDLFPAYTQNHIKWIVHDGKQHGLADVMDYATQYKYIICIDSSSNDYEQHATLKQLGAKILVIDHHEAPHHSVAAITINNQLSAYPNKALSGVGIAWLFCKYIDKKLNKSFADNYLDLVSVGVQSDMMSGLSAETKAIIFEGLKDKNIHNPFINGMIEKNEFSFNKSDYIPSRESQLLVSPMGVSFFLTPMINAICRSGTIDEKRLIFESMLKFKAFNYILSTKRGHKLGETEQVVTQALRVATNVKNRQERIVAAVMEYLEQLIIERNLLQHKVLLFLLEPGEVDPGVAGLVANKLMAKYQRCCAVLTKGEENRIDVYRGSMRAYSASGLNNFKDICESSRGCLWSMGHQSAAGLCIEADRIEEFFEDTDNALKDLPDETSYSVDYLWSSDHIDGSRILDISDMNEYIMTDLPRSYVCVKNVKITPDNTTWMKEKHLKVTTPSGVDILIWDCIEDRDSLMNGIIDVVCKCNKNQWSGYVSPQLICEEYKIVDKIEVTSVESWGF